MGIDILWMFVQSPACKIVSSSYLDPAELAKIVDLPGVKRCHLLKARI